MTTSTDASARALAEGRALSDTPLPRVLDFEALRREGLGHLAELAGALWTDFNTHDPGITLLEALVYGLNDLGYRARLPMADLLARKPGAAPAEPGTSFTARQILPCAPVTLLDWRKLLIDHPGVRNAWLVPATRPHAPFFADPLRGRLAYAPPPEEPDAPAVRIRDVYTARLDLVEHPTLGDLDDTTRPWRPTPPNEDPLPLEVIFPRWDSWRASTEPERRLAWRDAWLEGAVERVELLSTDIPRPGFLSADVRLHVREVGGALSSRRLSVGVALTSALRGTVTDRRAFLESELTRLTSETTPPLVAYHARLAAAFAVAREVDATCRAQRNLCQDFTEPEAARFEEVAVCADLDVAPTADVDDAAARALLAFEEVLGAPPRFQGLGDLLARGVAVEDVFDGPPLRHGFLLDEDVAASEPTGEVHGSDLIAAALAATPDVRAVRALVMASRDEAGIERVAQEPWRLTLTEDRLPRLAPDRCKLVLYKDGIPFAPHPARVASRLAALRAEAGLVGRPPPPPREALDLPAPVGRWRALDTYVPLRFDLPRLYGVGRDGLPKEASDNRRAQAKQLQEFLLLFDQLLASGVEQARHLDEVLSVAPGVTRTFFPADLRPLDPDGAPLHYPPPSESLAESRADFLRRRHAFLDHLLARFDEPLAEAAALVATERLGRDEPREAVETAEVESKAAFLRDYPRLSAERGRAFDVTAAARPWPVEAVTGLEARARHFLGLRHGVRRALSQRFRVTPSAAPGGTRYRLQLVNAADVAVLDAEGAFDSPSAVTAAAAALERAAAREDRYTLSTAPGGGRTVFVVVDAEGQALARSTADFMTDAEAVAAAQALREELATEPDTEGLHIIEHVLLRPQGPGEPLLEPGCFASESDDAEVDLYSQRATVVLPGWTGRFVDVRFRAFVEQTLRREAPSHVFLKLCWVDLVALGDIERAFRSFLEVLAPLEPSPPAERAARLQALVEALTRARSIYPVATLHDCRPGEGGAEGEPRPLVLGRNQLGTLKTERP